MENFADRLMNAVESKQNPSIIGLDSDFTKLPDYLKRGTVTSPEAAANAMLRFNKVIIDSIKDVVPAVKIQSAFYEIYGAVGIKAFWESANYAKSKGLLVIADVKRGDIGSTSKAYSDAYLGKNSEIDGITINPYLGSDGVLPFVESAKENGKGIFVLVKTSNPSSGEIQDLSCEGKTVYETVAELVSGWGRGIVGSRGYSSVGAVVGATHPEEAAKLRKIMPSAIFLVPGYGAQGGGARDVVPCFNKDGHGAIVHSARAVIFARRKGKDDFGVAARQAALKMRQDIAASLKEKGIWPW
ncbi:MAG: orotidine-5'-phosphate decarboxylase [Candidatus Aenigmatarchaeota archaeon]|nr:MAG: orotidine-5'-phosphate decarboxylase [Candidatus Aenigmarchaeota archaeon]